MNDVVLTATLENKLREYFKSTPSSIESGCLVTMDETIIPVTNVSGEPSCEIIFTAGAMVKITELIRKDNLFAWAHNHPAWPAKPSLTDITNHNIPANMIIYSNLSDSFIVLTPEQLETLNNTITQLLIFDDNNNE